MGEVDGKRVLNKVHAALSIASFVLAIARLVTSAVDNYHLNGDFPSIGDLDKNVE
jgi:hypothetical protein